MRRKERGGRQTCVSAKHSEEEGRSQRERDWLEKERDIYGYTYIGRGRKIDEPV